MFANIITSFAILRGNVTKLRFGGEILHFGYRTWEMIKGVTIFGIFVKYVLTSPFFGMLVKCMSLYM